MLTSACSKAPRFDSELTALKRYCLQLAHPAVTNFNAACPQNQNWKHALLPLVTDVPHSTSLAAPEVARAAASDLPAETDEAMPAAQDAAAPAAGSADGETPGPAELHRLSSTPTPPPSSSRAPSEAPSQQQPADTQDGTPDVSEAQSG